MHSTFTAREAAEIVAPHMFPERAREEAQRRHYEAEARRVSGVCVSGLGPAVWTGRSDAEIDAAEQAAAAARKAFAENPRGRFLAALRELAELSYYAEAEKARNAMNRGFADPDQPAIPGEVACALLALNELAGSDARKARSCLAEILLETHRLAA